MLFPKLREEGEPTEKRVLSFKGYDARNVIDEGAMRQMRNLSTDEYPYLCPRKKRGVYSELYTNPKVIMQRMGKLAVIAENKLYYGGRRMSVLDPNITEERRMVAINTKIVIFPDKVAFDITKADTPSECMSKLENTINITSLAFHKNPVTYESEITITPAVGEDLSRFLKGDAISFSGLTTLGFDGYGNNLENAIIENIDYDNNKIWIAEGWVHYPTETSDDWIETGTMTMFRKVPDLEYVLEYNNRLYGTAGNTIYASKLGDPTNWFFYATGTADASYAVAVSTDGEFTGIAPLPNQIVFFKENCIHKLYGYKPSNYQLITTQNVFGLEKGSEKSIQLINNTLYYKSREGIMAYTGDSPVLLSPNFGSDRYYDAVAGTDKAKYYVSMKKIGDGSRHFFVYDISKELWCEEDSTNANSFAFIDNKLLYVDNTTGDIKEAVGEEGHIKEGDVEWYARFGDYDEFIDNRKVYSKMQMRLSMAEHTRVQVWISVDGGAWESVCRVETEDHRAVELPIIPRRCDKFGILITGRGYVKIESLTRTVREGTSR